MKRQQTLLARAHEDEEEQEDPGDGTHGRHKADANPVELGTHPDEAHHSEDAQEPKDPDERQRAEGGRFAKGSDQVLGHGASDDKGVQEIGKPPGEALQKQGGSRVISSGIGIGFMMIHDS